MSKVMLVNGDRIRFEQEVESCMSIHEIEMLVCPEGFSLPVVALLNDAPVLRKDDGWNKTVIGENSLLILIELPLGGRSGSAMAVQMIAMVAAIAATWYLGGSGGALAGAGMSTTTANITAGVVGMSIQMAGMLVSSAITSQGLLDAKGAESASPTYSINASSNIVRLNQPEAEVFGRMRITPDYIAQPYTFYADNNEWGCFVFGCGRGQYDIETMMFGDTKFWQNGEYLNSGFTTEQGIPYSHLYDDDNINIAPRFTWYGPYRAISPGDQTQTITIYLKFTEGYGSEAVYNDDGDVRQEAVYNEFILEVECAQIDNQGNLTGEWHGLKTFSSTFASRKWFNHYITFKAPKYGQYAIRFRNMSPSTGGNRPVKLMKVSSSGITAKVEYVGAGGQISLFPVNAYTSPEVSGLLIPGTNADDYHDIGPYIATPADIETTQIEIDYAYANGLGQMTKSGGLKELQVSFRILAQKVDRNGNPAGEQFSLDVVTDKGKTTTAIRKTLKYTVEKGRYRIALRRLTPTNDESKNLDALTWMGLRSIIPGRVTFPQAAVAVKIMATNALSQGAGSRFSLIETRKLPVYDLTTRTWSEPRPTRTWAAAFCSACKSEWGGRMTDRQLDLETIWTINQSLTAKGWFFDACIDGAMSMWNIIKEMCQCVLVVPRMTGTVLSAVEDKAGRPVKFELSPRNIMRGSFSVTYNTWTSNSPDDVIVEYLDKDQGFASRDVECVLPDSESEEPITLNWIGITSREQAFRVATGYAARNRYRRVSVTCRVEGLGRIINVGDVVSVNHPRFGNTGGGIVTGFNANALEITVTKDFEPLDESSREYCSLVQPNGDVWGPVKIQSMTGNTIRLDASDYARCVNNFGSIPFNWISTGNDNFATAFAFHSSKNFQRRMLVQSVTVDDLWHYTVTLINDAPEAYQFQDMEIPVWGYKS